MKRVGITSNLLSSQFEPYLQARLLPEVLDVNGRPLKLLSLIDPIEVNPAKRPKETWNTVDVHFI